MKLVKLLIVVDACFQMMDGSILTGIAGVFFCVDWFIFVFVVICLILSGLLAAHLAPVISSVTEIAGSSFCWVLPRLGNILAISAFGLPTWF